MLVLTDHALVLLETPKCASTAVRRMLMPQVTDHWARRNKVERHIGIRPFRARWAARLEQDLGRRVETFCVVRDPLGRAQSWYRYRQRPKVDGTPVSTKGMAFEAFVGDVLANDPPPHARIGDQARFTGFDGDWPAVDHVFDFRQLDLLVTWLSDRLGVPLALDPHNVVAEPDAPPEPLSDARRAAFLAAREAEAALYARVSAAGALHRP